MTNRITVAVGVAALLSVAGAYPYRSLAESGKAAGSSSSAQVARGEYLVKGIAGCPDCHTPYNEKGELVMDKWLQGAKLTFGPIVPMPVWADNAPKIAGLEGWDREKAVTLMMKGLAPNGQPPRPPMPQYRMNRADAEAVVAYLKSLK